MFLCSLTPDLFKVFLLLLGVGVIKAHDELAFKCDLVVLVEQGSFCMANVKISAHRESSTQSRLKKKK